MATSKSGFLFSWGLNMSGQLGLGDFVDRSYPEHIKILAEHQIKHISAGYLHSGAVTTTDKLFMWGANPDCRLVKKLEYYKRSGRTKNYCNPQYCEAMA
jgi:alpha-tubulin suppressor-like RCC1 family protein